MIERFGKEGKHIDILCGDCCVEYLGKVQDPLERSNLFAYIERRDFKN